MASEAAPTRRQRRGEETRRRLIERTKEMLSEFDYQSITLDQVAAEVGISKSSIFWHFGSKEALLTEAVFQLFEEVDDKITLEKSNLKTIEERLDFLLRSVAEYFSNNPAAKGVTITLVFNNAVPEAIHRRIREHWDQHIREIQQFLSSDALEVSETCAAAILALMHGCYVQWYLRGHNSDIKQQLPDAIRSLHGELRQLIAADTDPGTSGR